MAKFCYADKVSPWRLWGKGAAPVLACWLLMGWGQTRFPSGHGHGGAVGAVGTEGVPGRVSFTKAHSG